MDNKRMLGVLICWGFMALSDILNFKALWYVSGICLLVFFVIFIMDMNKHKLDKWM